MTLSRRRFTLSAAGALASPALICPAPARALPLPQEKLLLSITGKIEVSNQDGEARFDRPMLESLGQASIVTSTPWYKTVNRFDGVPMHKLMQAVQASGERITALALNDYATAIPIEDFERYGVLLALKRDGEYMPVRDKGPLFIIYPFDQYAELQTQKYYSRSAWQLARLIVE